MNKLENLVCSGLVAASALTGNVNASRQTENYNSYRAGITIVDARQSKNERDYYFNPSMTDEEVIKRIEMRAEEVLKGYNLRMANPEMVDYFAKNFTAVNDALRSYEETRTNAASRKVMDELSRVSKVFEKAWEVCDRKVKTGVIDDDSANWCEKELRTIVSERYEPFIR